MKVATVDQYRAHLKQRLVESCVPAGLHEGLVEYIAERRPVGGFLTAVLCNDLRQAASRGDDTNRVHVSQLVCFLNNFAPATCWGSIEIVAAWLADQSAPPMVFE